MNIIVQKYGGSSVANSELIKHVATKIKRISGKKIIVVSAMGNSTDNLINLAGTLSQNPNKREMDLLLSTGELVSSALLSIALNEINVTSISLTGYQAGIETNDIYGQAKIKNINIKRIETELKTHDVVIVAGFQGITENEDITTLGRGGSDTTAVGLAIALKAKRCEIYTDVTGIYSADPNIVKNAKKIEEIGYEEMLELANLGAKMHPRSIELGSVYNMPIYVGSAFIDEPGTLIHAGVKKMEQRKKVTGVAYSKNISKITIRNVPDKPGIAAKIFSLLAKNLISVDTIVQNASVNGTTDLSFTVESEDVKKGKEIVETLTKEIDITEIISESHLGKVSIVGSGMQNEPGYAAKMFECLANINTNIEMITTSDIRITCIIKADEVEKSLITLHDIFELDK
tara:strand:- start:268 stop:1473 length:1206 start_codon:yes stop_codon:yes gene_type:complete